MCLTREAETGKFWGLFGQLALFSLVSTKPMRNYLKEDVPEDDSGDYPSVSTSTHIHSHILVLITKLKLKA